MATISRDRVQAFMMGAEKAFREEIMGIKIINDREASGDNRFCPTISLWSANLDSETARNFAEALVWVAKITEKLNDMEITITLKTNDPLIRDYEEYAQWCEFYYLMTKCRDADAIISSFKLNTIEEEDL